MRNSLAIIPARSGSKGLPDKNIRAVGRKPLMAYTIEAALDSGCFETVMVSTDSEVYAQIARSAGAEVPFLRSPAMASDTAGTWDAVREVLDGYRKAGRTFASVAVLQPTSPLRTAGDIQAACALFDGGANSVVSVTRTEHPVQWCFPLGEDQLLTDYAQSPYAQMRRQELEQYYQENGAIYLVDAEKIRDPGYNLYKDGCRAYVMPRERSADVDTELDCAVVEAILANRRKQDVSIRTGEIEDFPFFYDLKCQESNIFWTGHDEKPDRENLYRFFRGAVEHAGERQSRKIYIVEADGTKVGHLYLIPEADGCFELAIAISEAVWGRGYGKRAIALGLEEGKRLGFRKMTGSVREDNGASMKAFRACGVTILPAYTMTEIPRLGRKVKMFKMEKELT